MANATMAESSKGAGKSRWLVIGLLLILIASAVATAAYLFLGNSGDAAAGEAQSAEPVEAPVPIFVKVKPFTVNLGGDEYESRLLYIGLSLRVQNEQSQALLTDHMPQVRSRLLMLLSGQSAQELTTPDGKTQLAKDILAMLKEPLTEPQPPLEIRDVLFTEFIVQ